MRSSSVRLHLPPFRPSPRPFCPLLSEDDSPYPEVRSAVANTDDPDMPVNTFRAWFIGFIWSIILPGMNQFFFFRYPSVTVTAVRLLSRSYCALC